MSELISTAPLYTKDRVHLTKIGNILCTGKGCIGCDRKFQIGDQDLSEILGDVDLVDFDKQEPRFLSSPREFPHDYGKINNRRHGNTTSTRVKTKRGKLLRRSKLAAKEPNIIKDDVLAKGKDLLPVKKKINRTESIAIGDNKDAKRHCYGRSVKTNAQSSHKTEGNKTVSFAANLVRQRTFTLEEDTGKSETSQGHKDNQKHFTAPRSSRGHHLRSRTYPLQAEPKTNFLKMLHNSSVGIFDIELMQNKKSSKWVKEVLKSGVKKEEIFPQINGKKTRGSNKTTTRNSREEKSSHSRGHKNKRNKPKKLPNVSPRDNGRFTPTDDRSSVLVIEHSHEKTNAKDESLHKLVFLTQRGERTKNFPNVSILEIAESLEGFVQLGVIKLISQEHEGRWYILVSSRIIRDFLVQSGVTIRGRSFELLDCTNATY